MSIAQISMVLISGGEVSRNGTCAGSIETPMILPCACFNASSRAFLQEMEYFMYAKVSKSLQGLVDFTGVGVGDGAPIEVGCLERTKYQ